MNILNDCLLVVKKFKLIPLVDQRQLGDAMFVREVFNTFSSSELVSILTLTVPSCCTRKKLYFMSVKLVPTTTSTPHFLDVRKPTTCF